MRAIWTGRLTFGLLNIPIKIYSAIKHHSLGFRLLHGKCKTPIQNQYYCPRCDTVVSWDELVKGMKMEDDSFFIITKEKLEKLKPESTEYLEIRECIKRNSLDPIYFDSHYYVGPKEATEKGYFLLKEALEQLEEIAITTFAMRDKEYVCALQPYENGFLLSTLNYAYEIRSISDIKELSVNVSVKATKEEKKLAENLIKELTTKSFDITKYKDSFAKKLKEEIKESYAGKKRMKKRAEAIVKKKKEESLSQHLKESIEELQEKAQSRKKR